jgi:hypothetical protein
LTDTLIRLSERIQRRGFNHELRGHVIPEDVFGLDARQYKNLFTVINRGLTVSENLAGKVRQGLDTTILELADRCLQFLGIF